MKLKMECSRNIGDLRVKHEKEMGGERARARQNEAKIKLDFAAVTQRWLLETLFSKAKPVLQSKVKNPKNAPLTELFGTIKAHFHFKCDFPAVPRSLLYGFLSERVHVPPRCVIYVASSSDVEFKMFF